MNRTVGRLILVGAAVAGLAACDERLDSGAACPLLCPQQSVALLDTVLHPVVVDTTVTGYPAFGTEPVLLLSNRGDTLRSRVFVRYDQVPQHWGDALLGTQIPIDSLEEAQLMMLLIPEDSLRRPAGSVTIDVYLVDTTATGSDTVHADLAPFFVPERLIGSRTFEPGELTDTVAVPLLDSLIQDHIREGLSLRLGLELRSPEPAELRLFSGEGGAPPLLSFRPVDADTLVAAVEVVPNTTPPRSGVFVAGALADFTIVVQGNPALGQERLAAGGFPGRRSYLRFEIPARFIDSTVIVAASLILTQAPNYDSPAARDSIGLHLLPIVVSPAITNIGTALEFLSTTALFGLDSIRVAPADSGLRTVEIVPVLRAWASLGTQRTPRALGIVSTAEGRRPGVVTFFSSDAPEAVRPRLRITYTTRIPAGLP